MDAFFATVEARLADLAPHWGWLALGLVLATAEMLMPGYFLIWLAAAALLTGLLASVAEITLPVQVAVFAGLSIVAVLIGKRWLRANPITSPDPLMNDRGARLIGEITMVSEALAGGQGRVRHGDSVWLARGPDAEPGTRMRVTGHDGSVLVVEHLH
ncbi:MAG TPA: NfeD family protein [Novosphingobium sp.]|nr:NfeD family protein [Novosphingobium sp.]